MWASPFCAAPCRWRRTCRARTSCSGSRSWSSIDGTRPIVSWRPRCGSSPMRPGPLRTSPRARHNSAKSPRRRPTRRPRCNSIRRRWSRARSWQRSGNHYVAPTAAGATALCRVALSRTSVTLQMAVLVRDRSGPFAAGEIERGLDRIPLRIAARASERAARRCARVARFGVRALWQAAVATHELPELVGHVAPAVAHVQPAMDFDLVLVPAASGKHAANHRDTLPAPQIGPRRQPTAILSARIRRAHADDSYRDHESGHHGLLLAPFYPRWWSSRWPV